MKAAAALLLMCVPAVCASLAIQDVSVIDVAASAARPHMTVIVQGDRIISIGPVASTVVPKGAQIISGRDKFLMPGLWDMSVHLWYKENQLPVFLAFGVTGIQDIGSDFPRLVAWRDAIETGKAIGPHIVTSGPSVAVAPTEDRLPVLVAHDPHEARAAFDELWDLDVDFVRVLPDLPRDAYFALAEQARHWGFRLVGEIPSAVTAKEAIDARHRNIEHLAGISKAISSDREAVDFFEQCALRDVATSPGLVYWRRAAHIDDSALESDPRLRYVPETIRKSWPRRSSEDPEATREQVDTAYHLVSLMTRTNVDVLAGTDTGDPYTVPGATLHDELAEMVAAGMEPHQALRAATLAPARFLGWDEAMGIIDKGKVADMVLLSGNPLEDIHNTRRIEAVISRGKYYSRKNLDAILAAAAKP